MFARIWKGLMNFFHTPPPPPGGWAAMSNPVPLAREKILALTQGPPLDEPVARLVMNWRIRLGGHEYTMIRRTDGSIDLDWTTWSPSCHINAAWMMENRLAELGLTREYAAALQSLCTEAPSLDAEGIWQLIHAHPVYRCRAALIVVLEHRPPGRELDNPVEVV
jgi:hypothetical protein